MHIAVIGIGQSLRGDDGIGPEAVRRWSSDFPLTAGNSRVHIHLLETPGLELLDYLSNADGAVLVDAIATSQQAGMVQVMSPIPEAPISPAEKTAHGFGVSELLSIARRTGARLPERLILIGIEGQQFGLGTGFSSPVHAAVSVAAEKIQEQVSELLSTENANGI